MELYDVVTDLTSLAYCQYEELPADEREWWDDICDRDHAADATYAQLSAEEQESVAELLGHVADLDLDGYVEAYDGLLRRSPRADVVASRRQHASAIGSRGGE